MHMTRRGTVLTLLLAGVAAPALAGPRARPASVAIPAENISVLRVSPGGLAGATTDGQCFQYATHTQHQFINEPPGSQVILQLGFAEQEVAAASYTLPASAFPIRVSSIEMLFGSVAVVSTTTKWSVMVWSGPPNASQPIAEYSSDGVELPHMVMPPAFGGQAQGTIIQFVIDPGDPEQIIINPNPTNSFSVAFRIDDHNNGPANPCTMPPPSNSNAFPATDTNGLQSLFGNWIKALNCGGLACPGGWWTFGAYPSVCRPSGDWILRAQWESAGCGSTCYADCNGDAQLTVADFGCFQSRFAGGDSYADCDHNGQLTIADFACFQSAFVAGCP